MKTKRKPAGINVALAIGVNVCGNKTKVNTKRKSETKNTNNSRRKSKHGETTSMHAGPVMQ